MPLLRLEGRLNKVHFLVPLVINWLCKTCRFMSCKISRPWGTLCKWVSHTTGC